VLLGIDGMVLCSTHFAPRTFHRSNSSHGLPPVEGGLDHRVEQVIYCARDCDHDSGVLAAVVVHETWSGIVHHGIANETVTGIWSSIGSKSCEIGSSIVWKFPLGAEGVGTSSLHDRELATVAKVYQQL